MRTPLITLSCFALIICNSCFTYAQINLSNGLIAYYPFTGNANDASGNNLHGIVQNGASLTTDRNGTANSAYLFDGVNDNIKVTDINNVFVPSTNQLTIAYDFISTGNTFQLIGGKINYTTGAGANYNFGILNNNQNNIWSNHINPAIPLNCSQQVTSVYNNLNSGIDAESTIINQWHHAVHTFGNGVQNTYLDGVLVKSTTLNFTTLRNCTDTDFMLGAWWSGDFLAFKGKLDEVRVYNRVLNQSEISALSTIILPFNLVQFSATIENDKVAKLLFTTNQESGLEKIIVERSIDKLNFTEIGKLLPKNNFSSNNYYYFKDASLQTTNSKKLYYRLQFVEKIGIIKYSQAILLEKSLHTSFDVTIFPNPITNNIISLSIKSPTNKEALIIIYDLNGKELSNSKTNLSTGINLINTKPSSTLSKGTYLLKVVTDDNSTTKLLAFQ